MSLFTYHLVKLSYFSALKLMFSSIKPNKIKGLIHSETMSAMTLGSPIYSFSRIFSKKIIVFAQWEDDKDFENFLNQNCLGKKLSKSWYLKLDFLRQWGSIKGFRIPDNQLYEENQDEPVVAITIARMKYSEIPRFLSWGRPVEKLVRDHPGTTLSLASIRYPNIISTFSIWKTTKEMTDMVNSKVSNPKRHSNAMMERERKDFHFEFTTLRFKAISEVGFWDNRSNFVPLNTDE